MHWLFAGVDRADTKNTIRDTFLDNLTYMGVEVSRAKASKLADQYKRGRLDEMHPDLAKVISWSDPTGETAVKNVMAAAS